MALIDSEKGEGKPHACEMTWFGHLSWMPSLIIGFMHDLVSGSAAATIQLLKGVGAAVVFIVVYSYWRWLPQPHSF
jgi:hypothetical protein